MISAPASPRAPTVTGVEWAMDRSLPLGIAAAFAAGAGAGACLPLLGLDVSAAAGSALGGGLAGAIMLAVDGWALVKQRDKLLSSQDVKQLLRT